MRPPAPGSGRPGPPRVPGYRIEAVLGRGATGVVYRARQLSVDRPVALKVLHAAAVRSERVVRRLEREARTAALLAHPSIISAIDMGRAGDTYWFAMELVEGQSLAERLEHGGRLSERDVLRLFVPLADALQHACEKGVVHRDVKPANILLEASGRPRLVDLGLARVDDDPALTRTGGTLGTPFYISPEQARDPGDTDIRSDIWSLGATMFHAACGRPPFSGQGAAEILSNVLYEPIPDPRRVRPELSRGLALVIRKCLSRDPDRRYFAPAELRDDLLRIQEHKAPAVRESQLEPTLESGRRARRVLGAAAAAAAGALVLLLLALRPFERRVAPGDAPEPGARVYEPLEHVAEALALPRRDLAAAYHHLRQLDPHLPDAHRARWGDLYAEFFAVLGDELFQLRRELDPVLERALAERRFRGFERAIERDFPLRLGERTGFSAEGLPDALGAGLEHWRTQWIARFEESRAGAIAAVVGATRRFIDDVLVPRVDRLVAEGRWDEARALLTGGARAHFREARASPGELPRELLDPALHELDTRIELRLVQLEEAWRALDQDLARRARGLAREAEDRLRTRQATRVVEAYDAALAAELGRHRLSLDAWPAAPLRSETPEVHRRQREALFELEEELLAEDARTRFAECEAATAPLLRERRFAQARELWSERAGEPLLELLRDRVLLRVEEARVLEGLLESAAEGVRVLAHSGESIRLRIGTIRSAGRVEAGLAPLEEGFKLRLEGGVGAVQRLRLVGPPDTLVGGARLVTAALEQLAEHDPELERDVDFHLARALMRFHEDDFQGARVVLDATGLPPDDALVHELALRVERALGEGEAARARRRAYAARRLQDLDAFLERSTPRRGVELVQELLSQYPDVLSSEEARALRERRRDLQGRGVTASEEDFRTTFGADVVELRGDRVLLRWVFDEGQVGAWQQGTWRFDGRGWMAVRAARDVSSLVRTASPTLLLLDPLVIGRGVTELVLELEQVWPPRLLIVSVCGFHVALSHAGGEGSRALVDVGRLEDVAQRASAGQGQPVPGLREGETHRLAIRAHQARGTIEVLLDGKSLLTQSTLSPRNNPGSSSVSIRSSEPLRLLTAQLETSR